MNPLARIRSHLFWLGVAWKMRSWRKMRDERAMMARRMARLFQFWSIDTPGYREDAKPTRGGGL